METTQKKKKRRSLGDESKRLLRWREVCLPMLVDLAPGRRSGIMAWEMALESITGVFVALMVGVPWKAQCSKTVGFYVILCSFRKALWDQRCSSIEILSKGAFYPLFWPKICEAKAYAPKILGYELPGVAWMPQDVHFMIYESHKGRALAAWACLRSRLPCPWHCSRLSLTMTCQRLQKTGLQA